MHKVPGYWELSMSGFRCQTLGMSKTEIHNVAPPIFIEPFNEDPALCPVFHMMRLDRKLEILRKSGDTRFWLSSKKPHSPATVQTICKWLKSVIIDSGAVSGSARDVRAAGATTAAQAGIDLARIMEAADWKRLSTFQGHYFRPQKLDSMSSILNCGI
jgi:Phage integrase family.